MTMEPQRSLVGAEQFGQAPIRKTLALELTQLIGLDGLHRTSGKRLLGQYNVLDLREEPGVYLGQVEYLFAGVTLAEGLADVPDTLRTRIDEFVLEIFAIGHHRRLGGLHAETDALRVCSERGIDPAGATAWVTLEPCNHQGRQPACAEALVNAGIARVVYAAPDPNPVAKGGADALRAAGIETVHSTASRAAIAVSEPFRRRVETGLPWVIAKWAQTIDGRIATAGGDSKWISNEWSRKSVHRLRAKVDAVLTGIGTVLADDPELTARGVPTRRIARRVVVDPKGRMPLDCNLVRTVQGGAPLTISVETQVIQTNAAWYRTMTERGVDVVAFDPQPSGQLKIEDLLRWLSRERDCSTVLTEAGPGLLGAMHRENLLDQLCIYLAPKLLGDPTGLPPVARGPQQRIADSEVFRLDHCKRFGDDLRLLYRRAD